jgi:amino acid transporter
MPVAACLIIIGTIGGVNVWILGPSKSLLVACHDGCLPKQLGRKNSHGVPVSILVLQGVIFTALCSVFLLMPTVTSSFWVLSNITSILALIVYVAMFASAVKLRYKYPEVKRAFVIPGGKIGLWVVCGIGSLSCLFTIIIGFLPPSQIAVGNVLKYELIICIGVLLSCLLPFVVHAVNERSKRESKTKITVTK